MPLLNCVYLYDCSSNSSEMSGNSPDSGEQNPPMEQEKRIRREIANSNERRRMQSINAGFQSLRTLLPHHEGEKLSKVSQTALSPRSAFTLATTTKSVCVRDLHKRKNLITSQRKQFILFGALNVPVLLLESSFFVALRRIVTQRACLSGGFLSTCFIEDLQLRDNLVVLLGDIL